MRGRSRSQGIPLLPERARSEGARSTAAVGITLAVRPERATREEPEKLKRCSVAVETSLD